MCKIVGGNCIATVQCIYHNFFVFFEHDYSLKLSIGIIIIYNGNSNVKKVVFFKKQFCFAKTHNLLFRKKSTRQSCW